MVKNLTCNTCGEEKYHNGKKLICRRCNNARSSSWQKTNREKANKRNREWVQANKKQAQYRSRISKVRKIYGLSEEEYITLLEKHDHKCSICGRPERTSIKGTVWNLSIDHCHNTGKIRGLLCAQCNVGLAKFGESIRYFKNAIKYLQKWNTI